MGIIKGSDMMLFCKEGTGTVKSIAQATNHTLNISADTVDISTKDIHRGEWKASEVNMLSWTASSENLVADDAQGYNYSKLLQLMTSRTKITGYFGLADTSKSTDGNVPSGGWINKSTDYMTGEMVITNLTLNAPNGDNASFSVDFTGVGPLKPTSGAATFSTKADEAKASK